MKKKNEPIRLLYFIIILFILTVLGPSEERQSLPLDGSSSYGHDGQTGISPTPAPAVPEREAIVYWKESFEINGHPQVAHYLELDLKNPGLEVFPVLSQERLFGFEVLSEMNERHRADAAVNAGFNYAYGQPSGLVIQNGNILSGSMGYGRILLMGDKKAWFQNAPFSVWIQWEKERLPVDGVNPYPTEEGVVVFTPEYGPVNQVEGKHAVCVVVNNRVVSSAVADSETDIPKEGFQVVDFRGENSPLLQLVPGRRINIMWEEQVVQGYQCSGSLVENGVNVAKESDPWAGNLKIPTPRTAVGTKDDSTLVFLVVDGRQSGYSVGVTGKQLADILISEGVKEAALLDGGASSQMILNNETVNRPSTGQERLLASAFIIKQNGKTKETSAQ